MILCLILGKRRGFGKEPMPPHSMVLCFVGTGMLWVGWYGFNAGSALGADGIAANAFTTTTLATAVASLRLAGGGVAVRGKPSILGFCSGAVAGLVVITPACGFVTPAAPCSSASSPAWSRGSFVSRSRVGSAMMTRSTRSASTRWVARLALS